jgi:hypothetical protein
MSVEAIERTNRRERERYRKNVEKEVARSRVYRNENKEKRKETSENYKQARSILGRKRYDTDAVYRFKITTRNRLNRIFKRKGITKTSTAEALLSCSWEKAVKHLENNERGLKMTDKGIHVDHIRPLASFKDLSSAWEQKTANHYLNLQLLPAKENLSKSASFDYDSWAVSESGKALLALNREWRMETFFS